MIEYKTNNLGFMKDASYTYGFDDILQKYDGQFIGAEKVVVEIEEMPLALIQFISEDWLLVSEDRKELIIKFSEQRSYDTYGKETGVPDPESVFRALGGVMKRAVERYNGGNL